MKLAHTDYQQSRHWLDKAHYLALLGVIEASFNGISPQDYYEKYFQAADCFDRSLRLYFDGRKLIGYCLLVYSRAKGNVLIRASAAFYPDYRQGSNTFSFSIRKILSYWLAHPLQKIYYADTMLSPAMYRAMAKRVAIVYPDSSRSELQQSLFERFNSNGDVCKANQLRCLLNTGRSTSYSPEDLANFRASAKSEIQSYCNLNPSFDQGYALFVIIPVSFKQWLKTLAKFLVSLNKPV